LNETNAQTTMPDHHQTMTTPFSRDCQQFILFKQLKERNIHCVSLREVLTDQQATVFSTVL